MWGDTAHCLQIHFNTFAVGLLSTPYPMGHTCVFLRETPILILIPSLSHSHPHPHHIFILILMPFPFHSHPILISIPFPSSTPSLSHLILIPSWLPRTPHSDSPVAPGSQAGLGNPVERQELSRTPTATSCPLRGPRDPRPLRDTHLVPLLTSAAREPTLTPRSLQREGVRWVGGTSLHPQPPQLTPLHSPQPPRSRAGWAPTAGPTGPGRPSKPGGPWEGGKTESDGCGWQNRGEGSTWETPQPLCPWSRAPRDSPVPPSPRGGPRSLARP